MNLLGATAAVICGGFYGICIADHLQQQGAKVTVFEREDRLLSRASYCNQARLHGGYHYPRSFGTAYRSRLNLPRFVREFEPAVVRDFTKLYAIARVNSKVNARQFEVFCKNIGAPLKKAAKHHASLFNSHLIEAVYEAQEYVFDAACLASMMRERLDRAGVDIRFRTTVRSLEPCATGGWWVRTAPDATQRADVVVNCTYAGINTIAGVPSTQHRIKLEITEMALVELPEELASVSVTVMDGPFFSFMPFPDRGLATLSHVRYTPHANWIEHRDGVRDPYATMDEFPRESRFGHMIRDAQRYLPALSNARYRDSLFDVKAVLMRNEADDGRPILFETSPSTPGVYWVLGSKIDNIYDALAALDDSLTPGDQRTLTAQ